MGLLDDAIREHLELKRQHGASSEELAQKESEAFGPARRDPLETASAEPAHEPAEEAALVEEAEPFGEQWDGAPEADEVTRVVEPGPVEPELEGDLDAVDEEPALEPGPTAEDELEAEAFRPAAEPAADEPTATEPEPAPEEEPELPAAQAASSAPETDVLEPVEPAPRAPEAEPVEPAETVGEEREPRRGDTPPQGTPAVSAHPADEIFADEGEEEEDAGEEDEDVLEETPDFLQETPEHDRLWFEQRPPRDFDFDDD